MKETIRFIFFVGLLDILGKTRPDQTIERMWMVTCFALAWIAFAALAYMGWQIIGKQAKCQHVKLTPTSNPEAWRCPACGHIYRAP